MKSADFFAPSARASTAGDPALFPPLALNPPTTNGASFDLHFVASLLLESLVPGLQPGL